MNPGGSKNRWFFDLSRRTDFPQANELSFGRARVFLYQSLYRGITKHDLQECFQLVKLLPRVLSLDPYILFRFIMILIESSPTETINKNVIIYLETLISKLYINSPDIFVEFLTYFIKHNRIDDAKELFSQRHKLMVYNVHQKLPVINNNLKSYEFLLNYLQWDEKLKQSDSKLNFDVSIQGWIVNSIDCFKTVSANLEYFVMCLIRILLYYGYSRKAYLIMSQFQENNPDNISAQLLHLKILNTLDLKKPDKKRKIMVNNDLELQQSKRFKDLEVINNFTEDINEEVVEVNEYPLDEDKRSIISNLRRIDKSRKEILENLDMHDNPIDKLKDLMDGMETVAEVSNMNRWFYIRDLVNEIFEKNDEAMVLDARFLWHTRYRRFWLNIDFVQLAGANVTESEKDSISEVTDMLINRLNRSIE